MAYLLGYTALGRRRQQLRPLDSPVLPQLLSITSSYYNLQFCLNCNDTCSDGARWLSTNTESTSYDFAGPNAYELLGVSESSSFAEIKASFHKLAKQTHPDLAQYNHNSSTSKQFVQILAAYEILSDSKRREHYDQYLSSQRVLIRRAHGKHSVMHSYETYSTVVKPMEVVEWLKWYRSAINDILSEKRIASGSSYFDILERDFYSAIHAAYYGPEIESMDLFPDCFEAEERSVCVTPDVLQLVSGRDLLGMVRVANKLPELSRVYNERLMASASKLCQVAESMDKNVKSTNVDNGFFRDPVTDVHCKASDAYKDLELHVSGNLVAVATRVPPLSNSGGMQSDDSNDYIHVYLNSNEESMYTSHTDTFMYSPDKDKIPLGTIVGLGTSPDEGPCDVYDNSGVKTHVIMKHRTLLVKHMHWYQLGDKASVCECRCTRAWLPPSRFWLFEPRSAMYDIGGWYVETFGRDKKGRTVPSQRYWDGFDRKELFDKRLHPATYLLAIAYRTLDIEEARRRKHSMMYIVESKIHRMLSWCKKVV